MKISVKKIINILSIILVLGFTVGVIACGGGTTGTSDSSSTLLSTVPQPTWGSLTVDVATNTENTATTSSALSALASANVGLSGVGLRNDQIRIENIRMAIRDIKFEASGNKHAKPSIRGSFIINLIDDGEIVDESYPSLGNIRAVSAEYDAVSFKMDRLEQNQIPAGATDNHTLDGDLIGHSLVIEGSFQESEVDINDDGETDSWIDFKYIGDSNEKIKINRRNPIGKVVTDVNNYVFITFRVERWFTQSLPSLQEIDPETYLDELDDNDVLVIYDERRQDNSFQDLARDMERSIERSFGFARSEDDRFDIEDDDYDEESDEYEAYSDFEEDLLDDICDDDAEEDWDENCLEIVESCIDECTADITCWENSYFDDDEISFEACEDAVDECEEQCWIAGDGEEGDDD